MSRQENEWTVSEWFGPRTLARDVAHGHSFQPGRFALHFLRLTGGGC